MLNRLKYFFGLDDTFINVDADEDILSTLIIYPVSITNNKENVIIAGHIQDISSSINKFVIDGLYFNSDINTLIAECIAKNDLVCVECKKKKLFNCLFSKNYNTWKVIQLKNTMYDSEWLQVDKHSKIY